MGRFQKLVAWTTGLTLLLIAWGGLVRATGSGDGCPDWPRCFGRWVPPLEYHALIEYAHRLLATVVGLLVVAVALLAIRSYRRRPRVLWSAVAAAPLVGLQGALGGQVVVGGLHPDTVTAHLALAMLVVGVQTFLLVSVVRPDPAAEDARARHAGRVPRSFARLVAVTAVGTYVLLVIGAYVRGRGASLAFRDWPLMDGRLVPTLEGVLTVHFAHRLAAATVGLLVLYLGVRAWTMRDRPRTVGLLTVALVALFAGQVVVGALNVWTRLSVAAVVAHVTLSALIWAVTVALATVSHDLARVPVEEPAAEVDPSDERRPLRETMSAYVRLTKPRIIVLLLVTTVPAMILARRGLPSGWLIAATLVGGTIAAGSANAINCYLDRDIDGVMRRTRRRPLPAHEVDPDAALTFGFVLGAVSFFLLAVTVNVLAATLALSAIAFYVFVYTLWLKRTSTQNIVIGGAAGAVPALVGWAAVTGGVGLPALLLFAIVFVWTPPHFWALAMRYSNDYRAAGIPMLPVVRGDGETRRQILLYSLALFATTLAMVPLAGMGTVYAVAASVLGGVFVWHALRLWRSGTPARAMGLFHYSIVYLALLFAAVAVDGLVA